MRAREFLNEWFGSRPKKLVDTGRAHRDGIDLEIFGDGDNLQINADSHGIRLGQVVFLRHAGNNVIEPQDLQVFPKYRGQGIAKIMYDWAKELGYHIERSPDQTDAGRAFWDKNRGEQGLVWETGEKQLRSEEHTSELQSH